MIINYLAIIPARSGSKGIKNKNIKIINNKECFRYTLEPAIKSNIDKIFFSTDSPEYLDLYKKYYDIEKDVTSDYLRNNDISCDKSTADDYINECLSFLKDKGYEVKNFIILQPTSLFRTSKQINKVIKFHQENNYKNIKSVSPIVQSPYYMVYDNNETVIKNTFKNRQEHATIYIINGAYYVYNVDKYSINDTQFVKYILQTYEGLDLDDQFDLKLIKIFLNEIQSIIK